MNGLSVLGEAALEYAKNGWRIFPVAPGGKVPITMHGFLDATNDTNTVIEWWVENPEANIGFPTGSGVYVLDIDGQTGEDSLACLLIEHGRLPETLECRTGGGGRHIYFRCEKILRNSSGKLGDRLDTRGDGGYVILPPSIHPSGVPYEWTVNATSPKIDKLPRLPRWIVDEVGIKLPPKADFILTDHTRKTDYEYDINPIVREWFLNKVRALSVNKEGTRNARLYNLAVWSGSAVAGGFADEGYVERTIKGAARACGLGDREIDTSWHSGYEDGWEIGPKDLSELHNDDYEKERAKKVPKKHTGTSTIVGTPLSAVKRQAVDFLWGYRLVRNDINILVGDGGIGKGAVALHIARSVTDGMMDDGHDLPDHRGQGQNVRGEVLWITYEDTPTIVQERAEALNINPDRLIIIEGVKHSDDDEEYMTEFTVEDIDNLQVYVAELKDSGLNPKLLVVDPWASYLNESDNKEWMIRRAIAPLARFAQRNKITVIFVAHVNKSSEYTEAVHRISGHSGFKNAARSILMIGKVTDSQMAIAHAKHNYSFEASSIFYSWDKEKVWGEGDVPLEWGETSSMTPDELFAARPARKLDNAVNWLRRQLVDGPKVYEELIEDAEDENISKKTLSRACTALDIVSETSGNNVTGRCTIWRLPNGGDTRTPVTAEDMHTV